MAELFNTPTSNMAQQSQNTPPVPPMPPHTTPPFQGQNFRRKSRMSIRPRILGVIMVMLVVIALPAIVILSRQQQNIQQSAHTPEPKVTTSCNNNDVVLSSSFTISDVPRGVNCQIKATDSQDYLTDSFSYKLNDPAHSKTVDTHEPTISAGIVTFKTTCDDGFTKTNQVSYSQTKPCTTIYKTPTPTKKYYSTPTPTKKYYNTPTPTKKYYSTPTPSVTPSASPTPSTPITGTPTLCVTPGQVTNVKVTCPNCAK